MKLDIDFTNLENLVKNMGASSVDWASNVTVTHIENDWKIILETKGLDVDINDIEIDPTNGSLKYRDQQILLYIKEINSFGYNLPKFHFYQCATLNSMQNAGRFERYVVTQRKTGYFLMDKKVGYEYEKDVEEKLDVCKNCLNWFNRNYRKRYRVDTFDLVEFFENFTQSPISHKPTNTDILSSMSYYGSEYQKSNSDNTNKSQKSYSNSEINQVTIPKDSFSNSIEPVFENYVEISPVVTKTTPIELNIDKNTQSFEDMF